MVTKSGCGAQKAALRKIADFGPSLFSCILSLAVFVPLTQEKGTPQISDLDRTRACARCPRVIEQPGPVG